MEGALSQQTPTARPKDVHTWCFGWIVIARARISALRHGLKNDLRETS